MNRAPEYLWMPLERATEEVTMAWDRLVEQHGSGPFQSRQWIASWHRNLAPSASIELVVARQADHISGILALATMTRNLHRRMPLPLPYLGLAGSGPGAGDHLGPVAESDAVGRGLLETATQRRGAVMFESLDPRWRAAALAATSGTVVRRTNCPRNERLPPSSFTDAMTPRARKNARRRARKLAALGVEARWTPPGPGFADALRDLRSLHEARWRRDGQRGLFADERQRFLLDYARAARSEQGPWLLTLSVGHQPIASLLGIVFGDTFSVYKTGWSPDFGHLALGLSLGDEAMRWCEERGTRVFDYLRGGGSHKAELGCRDRFDVTVIRARGLRGSLLTLRETQRTDLPVTAVDEEKT